MVKPGSRESDALLPLAFSMQSSPDAYAVVIGAGASIAGGMPSAWNVLENLVAQIAAIEGADPDEPVDWYRERFGHKAEYEEVLARIAPTKTERQKVLRAYFTPDENDVATGSKMPTAAHRALADLVRGGFIRVIVTLNFDRLIETALSDARVQPTIVSTPADMAGLEALHTLECVVIHLHGDFLTPNTMLNTFDELTAYDDRRSEMIRKVVQDYGLLVVGWSATYDPALRDAISEHHRQFYTPYWIEPGSQSRAAGELRARVRGTLVEATADDALPALRDAVVALNQSRARHVLTLPVAVATAKRELTAASNPITLHDLLMRELETVRELPELNLADFNSSETFNQYAVLASRIEQAAAIPAGLIATCAFWGNEKTDSWWQDEISEFAATPDAGGFSDLIALGSVAGSILLYAAGIAATASRRYGPVGEILSRQVRVRTTVSPQPLATVLDPSRAYGGGLGGQRRVYGLLSGMLAKDLGLGRRAVEDAWQRFEILRMVAELREQPAVMGNLDTLRNSSEEQQSAVDRLREGVAQSDGATVTSANTQRVRSASDYDEAINQLRRSVAISEPHIFVEDRGPSAEWRSPVADQMHAEVMARAEASPLTLAAPGLGSFDLGLLIDVAGRGAGYAGEQRSWSSMTNGTIAPSMWLDAWISAPAHR